MIRQQTGQISNPERGSALLAALCFAAVLAIALSSYLALCYQTLKTSDRNSQSEHSIELAESGLEYALWARSNGDWSGWTIDGASGTATTTLDGADFNYSGGVTGSISLTLTHYDTTDTTTSTVTSTGTATLPDGTSVTRTLQAEYKKTEPFSNALAAVGNGGSVQIDSGGVTIDSYSSSADPDALSPGYAAIVSGDSVVLSSGATLKGYVATPDNGYGAVAFSYGTSAQLLGPATGSTVKIDTSRETTSPYQNVFDVTPPSGTALSEPSGDVVLGTAGTTTVYTATVTDGWYYIRDGRLIVDGTDVILAIPGSFSIYNSGQIIIKNGGSLKILVSGTGYIWYGGIDNQTKLPANLAVIGTNSSTGNDIGIWTPTKFYGTVYAPNHDITIQGYSIDSELFGSFVGNSITVDPYSSSNLEIHFDKDLRPSVFEGISTPYALEDGTWAEVSP